MRQTAVEWLISQLQKSQDWHYVLNEISQMSSANVDIIEQAKEMAEQELKDAYKHGRDDENCALSDGAMCPDYDNADEFYEGEYGGEQ